MGNVIADEPRPATASIQPCAIAAAVESCWKRRMGSSVDSTETVVPSLIVRVDAAAVTSDAELKRHGS